LLQDGVDAIREVPLDRWDIEALYDKDPDAAGKMYTRWCGLLDHVDQFDPAFFGISPREAVSMDPQQRLLLEVTWEALERAAYPPERLSSSQTGVYVGASSSDYARYQFADLRRIDAYAGTGVAHSILANRLSYFLDLQGPSMAVDTACSSSLVAVHLACQGLRSGECTVALAGGVNVILSPEPSIIFSRARMMAADGRCKTFDARADGYVRGEGCGVVVLKRLSDAQADGDPIWAVIRGSAINQDGRSNGLAAPNLLAQQRVIRKALASGNIEPRQVGYVEAHGTGTALGDPIEVEALSEIYGQPVEGGGQCLLGSVKTNIGHLEAAAGIAGLIKAVLCLQHREIPPHLHLRTLNPNITLDHTRFAIPTERHTWPDDSPAPLAAVSSFGFGGTNAHIILDAAPVAVESVSARAKRPYHLLVLSAKSAAGLNELASRYEQFLATSDAPWPDISATANAGRAHFPHRLAVIAPTAGAACHQLASFRTGQSGGDLVSGHSAVDQLRAGFLFTGQGSQYYGMGRQLYETDPTFRSALDRCAGILDGTLDRPLLDVMFDPTSEVLHQTNYTQPALFALEWSLAQLWMSWGIQPDCVLGHSLGELVAACVAGVFSLEDGLRLVAARGRLTKRYAQRGAMAAIFADATEVRSLLETSALDSSVIAENGPSETVIGGSSERVAAAVAAAERAGLRTRALSGSVAFHSPLMDSVLRPFMDAAAGIRFDAPRIPLISNRTGRIASREELCNPDYWVRQLREPVRFSSALQCLMDRAPEVLIEIGPHPTLLNIQQRAYPDAGVIALPSLRKDTEDWRQMLHSLARYYIAGGRVNWKTVDQHYASRRVALPTYPFQRARYWLDLPASGPRPEHFYRVDWRIQLDPPQDKSPAEIRWVLKPDSQGVAAALAERLLRDGADVQRLGEHLDKDTATVILDFSSLDAESVLPTSGPELVTTATRLGGSVLRLVQSTVAENPLAKIWLITRGAQSMNGERPVLPQTPIWGLGRVLAHEHPTNFGGLIDLDPAAPPAESAKAVAKLVLGKGDEDQWVVRGGQHYAARLVRYTPARAVPIKLDASGTYLISGGLGELGLSMTEWLSSHGARYLALAGRRAAGAAQQKRIDALRHSGVDVRVFEADIADPEAVAGILETIAGGPSPLRGVIHCAGTLDDGVILRQDESRLERVLAPKVSGAWELHRQTAASDLQFFVLCSSAAGMLGSPGQSNYAAANVFLDALALWRRADGLPALSVQWGPWSIGMDRSRRSIAGLKSIEPHVGLGMLEQLLSTAAAEVAAIDVNWPALLKQNPDIAELPFFAELRPKTDRQVEPDPQEQRPRMIFNHLASAAMESRPALIRDYLEERMQAALHSNEPITDTQNILDLGMDSLMIVEVLNDCRRDLQIALYPREMYSLPNFGALAQYLAREFERSHGKETSTAESVPPAMSVRIPESNNAVGTGAKLRKGIVFLLSSPRSGSTLLRVMLAGHPDLFSPPELHLLPFDSMGPWGRTLAPNYLTEGLQRALMELLRLDAKAAQAAVQSMIDADKPAQQIYAMLQDLAGDRMVVDKSPTYGVNIATLRRAEVLFERPRYIHLVRHPFAVIESFVRNRMDKLAGIETQDPYGLAEQAWLTTNNNIRRFLQEVDPARRHFMKYEQLVTDPEAVARSLCAFLEIPFEPAMLKPYEGARMTDGVHARSLPIGDPAFLSHSEIDSKLANAWRVVELPWTVGPETSDLAETFGYQVQPQHEAPQAGADMREQWLEVRGLRLCLCTWGPEDGRLVLCLHGILEHGEAWELVAARLAARGFRIVAPDLRGHGRSSHGGNGSTYHLLEFLADVDGIARNFTRPFVLVGHSMGAAIAAMYASARPEWISNLVLVEPPSSMLTESGGMADLLAVQLDHLSKPRHHPVLKDVPAAARRLRLATPSIPLALAERMAARLVEPHDGGVRWRWDPMLRTRAGIAFDGAALTPERLTEMLQRISAPTTIVYGDASRIGSEAARVPLTVPGARRLVLPGGHHLHFDAAEQLANVIAAAFEVH
jgi:acyl transferase domain-containing protein/alpha-beta hydrolase superfamily lysophospholipase